MGLRDMQTSHSFASAIYPVQAASNVPSWLAPRHRIATTANVARVRIARHPIPGADRKRACFERGTVEMSAICHVLTLFLANPLQFKHAPGNGQLMKHPARHRDVERKARSLGVELHQLVHTQSEST